MLRELFAKWFGLDYPIPCTSCEILSAQLAKSESERRELLTRLLDGSKAEPSATHEEKELKPIGQNFIPWRVRQQMLESEDREKARLIRAKKEEMSPSIEALEKELDIAGETK